MCTWTFQRKQKKRSTQGKWFFLPMARLGSWCFRPFSWLLQRLPQGSCLDCPYQNLLSSSYYGMQNCLSFFVFSNNDTHFPGVMTWWQNDTTHLVCSQRHCCCLYFSPGCILLGYMAREGKIICSYCMLLTLQDWRNKPPYFVFSCTLVDLLVLFILFQSSLICFPLHHWTTCAHSDR